MLLLISIKLGHLLIFCAGASDWVKCFYCNVSLHQWNYENDPFEEHAKWYPTCKFILQTMGPDYVHAAVERFSNIRRPVLRRPCYVVDRQGKYLS